MIIKIDANDNDYLAFNQYHILNSTTGKKSLLYIRLFPIALSVLIMSIMGVRGDDTLLIAIEAVLLAIMCSIFFAFSKKILLRSVRKSVERLSQEGRLPYSRHSELHFGENSITDISDIATVSVSYEDIIKICDEEEYLFIYYGAMQAILIPKRCLLECELEEVKRILYEKISN